MGFGSWQELVREPADERHIVHLYRERRFLREAVATWLAGSLGAGGGALLVCTPENAAGMRNELATRGLDVHALERTKRLSFLDADDLMSRFMVDEVPDGARFRALASDAIAEVRRAAPEGEVRAWGEMVNLLWHRGNRRAARALESQWNDVIASEHIRLLCSYEVDNLSPETHTGALREICDGHTALIPEDDYGRFETAVARALGEVFGAEADSVRALFASRLSLATGMPPAERVLVALHDVQPELARRVLKATRTHLAALDATG